LQNTNLSENADPFFIFQFDICNLHFILADF
jgi:hypothetical protein